MFIAVSGRRTSAGIVLQESARNCKVTLTLLFYALDVDKFKTLYFQTDFRTEMHNRINYKSLIELGKISTTTRILCTQNAIASFFLVFDGLSQVKILKLVKKIFVN